MKVTRSLLFAGAASLRTASGLNEAVFEGPVLEVRQGAWTMGNCYSSAGSLQMNGTAEFQTDGLCETLAQSKGAKVIGLFNGDTCYYGNSVPSDSAKVDMSQCSSHCPGFGQNYCGGPNAYLIYTQGSVPTDASSDGSGSSNGATASATTSTPVQVVSTVAGGTTIIVTQAPESAAAATISVTPSSTGAPSAGPNKTAIAAGVVVAIIAVAALAGGVFFYMRSKKHHEEAAQLHRANSVAALSRTAEKPPSTYSLSDQRLDPAFVRRMSDGSIADNQDYSRRILRVANPDDR